MTRPRIPLALQRQHERAQQKLIEVERKIVERTTMLASKCLVQPTPLGLKPLIAHVSDYIQLNGVSPSVANVLRRFHAFVGSRELDQYVWEQFVAGVKQSDYAESTQHQMLASIWSFLSWLQDTGRTSKRFVRSKAMRVKVRPVDPKVPMTKEDKERLLLAAGEDSPLAWLVLLGWHTGMAISDCCTLVWREVDWERCLIKHRRLKTRVEAVIPFEIGGEFHDALFKQRAHAEARGEYDPNLPVSWWLNANRSMVQGMFRKLCRAAGLAPEKTFHCFRAAMVSDLVNNGVNSVVGMKITGHRTSEVFARYATVQPEQARAALMKVR